MDTPAPDDLMHDFFERLRSREGVLFLDYDGTLAPFRRDPTLARPYAGLRERLLGLQNDNRTRLVIVSGRRVSELGALLGLDPMPELWGCHGWEHVSAGGDYEAPVLPERTVADLRELYGALADCASWGARREYKPAGLALHWRGLDRRVIEHIRRSCERTWGDFSERQTLKAHAFDGGIEFRVPGRDKGYVVDTVLSACRHPVAAAFLGDDLTDEDAFRAIRGRGIGILVHRDARHTAATLRLRPPREVMAFIDRWLAVTSGGCE